MSSHGPWSVEPPNDYMPFWTVYRSNGDYICDADDRPTALLLSAAPELRQALDKLLSHYIRMIDSGDCGHWNPRDEPQVKEAGKALAKARGDQ
jgi:hypothetical protein